MEEILENKNEVPEEKIEAPAQDTAAESETQTKPLDAAPQDSAEVSQTDAQDELKRAVSLDKETPEEDEQPAEMSLEGRKTQLEEKVQAQLDRQPGPTAAQSAQPTSAGAYGGYPTGNVPYSAYAPAANAYRAPKQKMPQGSKAYIILISGMLVVFTLGFILECTRAFKQNGLFGGDIDRFLDSDVPFGDDDTDDEDFGGFGGLFPFDFGDSDIPEIPSLPDLPDDDEEEPDSEAEAKNLVEPPDKRSVIDPEAANLTAKDQPDDIDSVDYTARLAYKKVENSVVNVVVYGQPETVGNDAYKEGTGSGIIVSQDGYIITNSHVIDDTEERGVEIITTRGDSYVAAIVGYDSRTDLAVLKINETGLTPAEFVNSDQIEIGQDALAVGNPGGVAYSNSLTRGCVSALNRTISANRMVSYIQTDAAINPGNSGGPLLNSAGQVMGITTIKIANTDYEGMGFAIPSNTAIEIANSLIAKGYIPGRVKLGITAALYDNGTLTGIEGILIHSIDTGSPFEGTEVRPGDVITKIDGKSTATFSDLYSILGEHEPGDEVTVSLYREPSVGDAGKNFKVTISLVADERDADADS